MMKKIRRCEWIVCLSMLLVSAVSSKNRGNPANDLIDIINANRTSQKLAKLKDSPGLGCIALQYAKECEANCTSNNTVQCEPSEDDFPEIFAPDCGVELPTMATISGYIIGCQSKYLQPSLAFSKVLFPDSKSLAILKNKTHGEVGVGFIRGHKGPFFWCVLFSSSRTNSTFVLEDRGQGIKQKQGCYSGSSAPCSGGAQKKSKELLSNILTVSFLFMCALLIDLPT